jgi:N-acetylneuraminic acid mutarotase
LSVAEAQGAMMGDKFMLVSGYSGNWDFTTPATKMLDVVNPTATWQNLDNHPQPKGTTHGGYVVVGGTKFYMCGGYVGGGHGPTTNACYVLDITKPSGQQWTSFTSLPDRGRAGGGMVYDSATNSLIFAGGAVREFQDDKAKDLDNTWMYSLSNPQNGWVAKAPIPYTGNHMSFVTARDGANNQRHFFLAGQKSEGEANDNIASNFEYVVATDTWIARQSLPFPRGHASSSTNAFGCGFLVVAGCKNGSIKVSDVTYYEIDSNTWTKIGDYQLALNTPVCDIHRPTNTMFCEGGGDPFASSAGKSFKRQLI